MGSSPSKKTPPTESGEGGKWAEPVAPVDKPEEEKKDTKAKRNPKVSPLVPSPSVKEEEPKESKEAKEHKEKTPIVKGKLTEGIVQDYINLEKSLYNLERKNVIKKYEEQTIATDNLKNTVEQLEAVLKELRKQTEREKSDLINIEQASVKDFLKQQGTWDERHATEKKEYEQATNKQDSVEKELRVARVNFEKSQKITDIYKKMTDNLYEMYDQEDKMLVSIFGADYSSDKENVLEGEADEMMEWSQRVSLAMFKWSNGRILLVHSLTQLTFGINRWNDAIAITKENPRGRYFAAAEARNNFIAAAQNVQSCRMYLNKVDFPYATEEEIHHMEDTVTSAFKATQDDKVMKSALKVFQEMQQKVASLIQWFDKVIKDTIRKDLDQANNSVMKKQKALREERLSLMKKRVKAALGKDMKIEYDDIDEDELQKELKQLEDEAMKEIQMTSEKNVNDILTHGKDNGQGLPLAKLAPIPSKDTLFGEVKQKLSEHDSTRKQFEKRNNLQREKQAMALQEKLKMRQQKQKKPKKTT